MACVCEKREACCCAPIGNVVVVFLSHMAVHGVVVAIFVFTNYEAPPLNIIDYFFAGNALCLSLFSFLSLFMVRAKRGQFFRGLFGFLVAVGLVGNMISTIWFSIDKWGEKKKTLIWHGLRPKNTGTDPFWTMILVFCWIVAVMNIYYFYCILSFMCNPYKTYLFVDDYQSAWDETHADTSVPVMRYQDRYQYYKPYPVQKS